MISWESRCDLIELYHILCDEDNMYLLKLASNQELIEDEKNKYKETKTLLNKTKQLLLDNKIPF